MTHTPEQIAAIAGAMSGEQRDWIAAMPTIPVSVTEKQWDEHPPLYVQFTPDEFCPETGIYLGGGKRHWFGAGCASKPVGADWFYATWLNETGLAVRAHLQKDQPHD